MLVFFTSIPFLNTGKAKIIDRIKIHIHDSTTPKTPPNKESNLPINGISFNDFNTSFYSRDFIIVFNSNII